MRVSIRRGMECFQMVRGAPPWRSSGAVSHNNYSAVARTLHSSPQRTTDEAGQNTWGEEDRVTLRWKCDSNSCWLGGAVPPLLSFNTIDKRPLCSVQVESSLSFSLFHWKSRDDPLTLIGLPSAGCPCGRRCDGSRNELFEEKHNDLLEALSNIQHSGAPVAFQ